MSLFSQGTASGVANLDTAVAQLLPAKVKIFDLMPVSFQVTRSLAVTELLPRNGVEKTFNQMFEEAHTEVASIKQADACRSEKIC